MKIATKIKYQERLDIDAGFGTKKNLAFLTTLTIGFAIFEGLGIAMLLPILELAETGSYETASLKGRILDQIIEALHIQEKSFVLVLLLASAFLALVIRSALQYARDIRVERIKFAVTGEMRKRGVKHFLESDMTFMATHDRGELFNILTVESNRAAEAVVSRIVFLNAGMLLLLYLILLFFLSPFLAFYTLPIFAGVGYIFKRQGGLANAFSASVYERNKGFAERIIDYFNGLIRIKMRAMESRISQILSTDVSTIMNDCYRIERLRILVEIGIYPVLVLAAFFILYVAIIRLEISLAELGVFMFVVTRLVPQLTLMNSMWAHMHGCIASLNEMKALLKKADESREVSNGRLTLHRLKKGITLDKVSFRYPRGFASAFQLNDLSFFIPRGCISAIVGRSGAGKTTILGLLVGFYRNQGGDIRLDGIPLTDYSLSSLRRKIAYVPQEPLLFHDSIRNNINFGLSEPLSENRIMELLRVAHCIEVVEALDNGLDSVVGERGCRLSQGQKQRFTIACALATEPEILVLDEPTSALDSESETAIQKTLSKLKGFLTVIVVAHRFSTISMADQVLLLDRGRLVGCGTHEYLYSVSPLYQTLFQTRVLK